MAGIPGVPARLLDLTRLVSRLGRGPLTGIDRVEYAYLAELLRRDTALFALVRTAAGYLLLDRAGASGIAALIDGTPPGNGDLLSRLTNRRDPARGRAEAAARRLAIARAPMPLLRWLLWRLPKGTSYLNVGHTNLSDRALTAVRSRCRIVVLLHDTIPLDHSSLSRRDTVENFRRKIAAVAVRADLVIHTAQATRRITESHLRHAGRIPPATVAPLGVPQPAPTTVPDGLRPASPYFVVLGTVEPRKNHALLMQVWTDLARDGPPPSLLVIGARGWVQADAFDRLLSTPGVLWLSGLADGVVAGLLHEATALLFPSLAEGFGLPTVEAAALGTPVIASDLPVIREMLGNYPIYLAPADSNSWKETINALTSRGAPDQRKKAVPPPSWEDHFNTVLNLV